jgi:hypothetical protein
MMKWIWKVYAQKESLWVRLLHAKYMRNGDLFKARGVVRDHNFGKTFTRLNICLSGEPSTRLGMDG